MIRTCQICNTEMERRYNESRKYFETKKFCSAKCVGVSYSQSEGHNKGRRWKLSEECNKRKSIRQMGAGNPAWKGGVTPEHQRIRNSKEHGDWSISILRRDHFTCRDCGVRGGKLVAHHIKSFALFPELRFDLDNGMALCRKCHYKVHH